MPTINTPNTQEVIKKGQEIYESKKTELELPANIGKYVVVEVNSGDYFIGNTREEAVAAARVKYPNDILFARRIGVIDKVARHSPRYAANNKYACLL